MTIRITSLALIFFMLGCDGARKVTTTAEHKVPTGPPAPVYPLTQATKPADNALPTSAPVATCGTQVAPPLQVFIAGPVRGGLKYNTLPRGKGGYPETNNDNTTLGGFLKNNIVNWYQFKYQVEVTFVGPMKDAVYGQMISDPTDRASTTANIEFKDDSPENDAVGNEWTLEPGQQNSRFPVVEVAGQTVRWIDAPGGYGTRWSNTKSFIIDYAGACGVITHLQVYKYDVVGGAVPTMTALTLAQLKAEVGNFSFRVP